MKLGDRCAPGGFCFHRLSAAAAWRAELQAGAVPPRACPLPRLSLLQPGPRLPRGKSRGEGPAPRCPPCAVPPSRAVPPFRAVPILRGAPILRGSPILRGADPAAPARFLRLGALRGGGCGLGAAARPGLTWARSGAQRWRNARATPALWRPLPAARRATRTRPLSASPGSPGKSGAAADIAPPAAPGLARGGPARGETRGEGAVPGEVANKSRRVTAAG